MNKEIVRYCLDHGGTFHWCWFHHYRIIQNCPSHCCDDIIPTCNLFSCDLQPAPGNKYLRPTVCTNERMVVALKAGLATTRPLQPEDKLKWIAQLESFEERK